MNPVQSNSRQGVVPFLSNETLTDKEGYLVKLVDATGRAKVALPSADSDPVQFVLTDGGASGEPVSCQPLTADRSVRCIASGAIAAGVAVAVKSGGKVQTITGLSSGTYFIVGYAEEDAADGQYVRVRPQPRPYTV